MFTYLGPFLIAGIIAFVVYNKKRKHRKLAGKLLPKPGRKKKKKPTFYDAANPVFDTTEVSLLSALDVSFDPSYFRIFTKIPLTDVVKPKANLKRKQRVELAGALVGKKLDFIICGASKLDIMAAIEIDRTSLPDSIQQPDDEMKEILEAAQIPFVRIRGKKGYTVDEIREALSSVFNFNPAG
tara:strand:+ start:123 stop:671 length:549 start_codon:yes stop_codon:yes gene_type:complete